MTPVPHRDSGERGFIIVAVLWILGAPSALVLVYLSYVTNTAMVVAANTDRPQADALRAPASNSPPISLSLAQRSHRRAVVNSTRGSGRIASRSRSSPRRRGSTSMRRRSRCSPACSQRSARAPTPPIRMPIASSGGAGRRRTGTTPRPRFIASRVQATRRATRRFRKQKSFGWCAGYLAFGSSAMPHVTTFSNQATVNVQDAAPQVVAALPTMTPERLQAILTQRSDPRIDPRGLAVMAGDGASVEPSKAYRVNVAIAFDNGRRTATEAVILLLESGYEPYRVLSWRNTFDGDATLQQTAAR